ncbi:MAG: hypothetical protein ACT6S0_03970 [Roseateles sp.]|uniref:hypothetical protein n=1 Tax=Roseateles sp. TaxID=1971397 RepID=UPI0040366D1D
MDSTTSDSADQQSTSASEPLPTTAKQLDPIDQPARPLGAKRFALQAQRHRHSVAAWRSALTRRAAGGAGRIITSADGTLAFAVIRIAKGLMVERRHWPAAGLRVAQTMVFDDVGGFDRWCDTDPLRFGNPQLHAQLRREGHEAFDGDR